MNISTNYFSFSFFIETGITVFEAVSKLYISCGNSAKE